ncbi:MAG: PAS domain-containing protein [Comamonadaceae bacterium]|nr:PAS domain-containing protein [Comamonadaceae bacterium]
MPARPRSCPTRARWRWPGHRRAASGPRRRHASLAEPPTAAFFETTSDAILRFDAQQRVVYVNPALERATALPRASFVGRRLARGRGLRRVRAAVGRQPGRRARDARLALVQVRLPAPDRAQAVRRAHDGRGRPPGARPTADPRHRGAARRHRAARGAAHVARGRRLRADAAGRRAAGHRPARSRAARARPGTRRSRR